jgi:predicted nucleic acid-binding protein
MVGSTPETEEIIRGVLTGFDCLPIDERIGNAAVLLRKQYKIKLPDAIVWATAQVDRPLLVTRNTKDFSQDDPGVRFPYRI